jgi:hypothetical protein
MRLPLLVASTRLQSLIREPKLFREKFRLVEANMGEEFRPHYSK